MRRSDTQRLSRRHVLAQTVLAASSAILTACGGGSIAATPAPTAIALPSATPPPAATPVPPTPTLVPPTLTPTLPVTPAVSPQPSSTQHTPAAPVTLRALAEAKGLKIGTLVLDFALGTVGYHDILTSEFDVAVIDGGPLHWDSEPTDVGQHPLRPSKDTYDFTLADRVIADSPVQDFEGHHLVWGVKNRVPPWLWDGTFSREELIGLMQEHITKVVTRYQGKISQWSVVNETTRALLGMGQNLWYDRVGVDYIALAFQTAHAADPGAKLFINETGAETQNAVSDRLLGLVKTLKDAHAPIDGVGFQMHLDGANPPSKDKVFANLKRFADLGLSVYITEFDVNMSKAGGSSTEQFTNQGHIYKDVLDAALATNACRSISFFGISDLITWLGRSAVPLLYDELSRPKPAYFAVRDALSQYQPGR